jgi:hypothetical protein
MRRLFVLVAVALLGTTPLAGWPVVAQEEGSGEWVDEAWDNVARPTAGAPPELLDGLLNRSQEVGTAQQTEDIETIRDRLLDQEPQAGYVVQFLQNFAHIPEIPEAEMMAVYVRSGEFVLENRGPEPFTVVPGGDGIINTLNVEIEGDDQVAHYTEKPEDEAVLLDRYGNPCTNLCEVDPPASQDGPGLALQLLEEDWVLLPGEELCIWCLLNQFAVENLTSGTLYVYPLLVQEATMDEFSWVQSWDDDQGNGQGARALPAEEIATLHQDSSATDQAASTIRAWAYFSPAPNCRSP